MAYSTISKPTDHFTTHLYSGNDSTNNQTSLGMTPDLVWVKCRNNSTPSHYWVDKVRGDKKYISSNRQDAEATDSNTFDLVSGGFNLAGGNGWTNVTGRNYVAWNWKAGNSAGSANTDGTINSTVSVNTTAGFSIVKYTGGGSAGTVGHGLSAAPEVVILKSISGSDVWATYHKGIDATAPADYFIQLQSTAARTNNADFFNDTLPTNQVFSIGANSAVSNNGSSFIAYCFSEKTGYSKFGSYTGNGNADGAFVYTGFKPAMVIIKRTNGTAHWTINDTKRLGYNPCMRLYPNLNTAEETSSGEIDLISNGFKCKNTNNNINGSGDTYVYMAFAEEPLVANVGQGIPATAR